MKQSKENLVSFLILFIGIVVAVMLFLPALAMGDSDSTFLGYEVVFGTEFANLGGFASGEIAWSPLALIGYLAPLAAGVVVAFTKLHKFIAPVLFALGALLLFMLPLYTTATVTVMETVTDIDMDWSYAFGLVIAAVLATLGSIVSLIRVINQ